MSVFIRNKGFQLILLIAAVAVIVFVVGKTKASPASDAGIGDKAPYFKLAAMDGGDIRLSDYEGKGVVLNFWASWCNPCVNELPLLNEAYKLAGVDMIAVNVGEDEATARRFVERYELAFPIALDRDLEAKKLYRAAGLPLTVVIDAEGQIIERHEGELTDMSDIMQLMGRIKP